MESLKAVKATVKSFLVHSSMLACTKCTETHKNYEREALCKKLSLKYHTDLVGRVTNWDSYKYEKHSAYVHVY